MANLCAASAITARRGKSRHTGRMSRTSGGAGRAAVALLAAAALLAAPVAVRPALADDAGVAQARQHFQRGKQLFDAGDYRAAIAEFAAADRAAPSPMLEFNIALCHERLGERAEAVRRYRLYLERVPNATNRASVEAKIRTLEAEIAAEARPAPGPAPGPVGPGPMPEQPPAEAAPEPPAPGPAEAAPAPTGDEELDRVAAIDIGRVRAERQGAIGAPAPGAPPAQGEGAGAPPPAEPAARASKPLYKQWWFWVVAGVGAIILIDIATSDSSESDARGLMLPEQRGPGAQPGGAVLLRF